MDFVQLTHAQRRTFDADGFLAVPQAIKAETVTRLTRACDRLAEAFISDPAETQIQLRRGIVQEEAFDALVANAATVSLVVQLLSPNIHLHSASLIYKKPQDPHATPPVRSWHRDIGIAEDLGHSGLPRLGIKVCYCLSDFPLPSSGMTLMARGTHRNAAPLAIPTSAVDPPSAVDPTLRAGDAILFENRTFHSGAPNLSLRTSKVAIYGYAYRWMKTDQYLDPPDEQVLQRATTDIDRQLLGGYRNVDATPRALIDWAEQHGVNPDPVSWSTEV
jgi:ectoine hydroxylase-related dioxygenase (phytanoyl-CoA dioxygenase family)